MAPIHATVEQTNIILRGGNKKKHMKNSKKNIVQGAPDINLYPVKQFRKGEEWKEGAFINSLNNNNYNKHKKNKVYNERTMSQVIHGNFNKFIKNGMKPNDFNEKLNKYYNHLNDNDLENLRTDYAKFYNDKLEESRAKYKAIRDKYEKKKKERQTRNEIREQRERNISLLEEKIYDNLEMNKGMTHAKCQRRINIIYNVLQKAGYSSVDNYINSSSDNEIVF